VSAVLAFVGSARRGGNTDVLVAEAMRGVEEAGADARRIALGRIELHPCLGCMDCGDGTCGGHQDDMARLLEEIPRASGLIFATPVYFWNVSGLMKTLWDRMLPLAGLDLTRRPLEMNSALRGIPAASIVVQEEAQGPHTSICELFFRRNFADFGLVDRGSVYAYGALTAGEVKSDAEALAAARALGRTLLAPTAGP